MGNYGAGVVEGVDEAGIPPGLIVGGAEPAGARVKPRALEGEGGTGSRLCGADGAGVVCGLEERAVRPGVGVGSGEHCGNSR